MIRIKFTSSIPNDYLNDLKKLLYFNKYQSSFINSIQKSISIFGMPELYESNDLIKVRVGDLIGPQLLCAIADTENYIFLGILIFHRDSIDRISVIQISVIENDHLTEESIGLQLLFELKKIAHSIKGVNIVRVFYGNKDYEIMVNKK